LRNALPERFRIPDIVAPPSIPDAEIESAYVALYTFIIAVILLSGGTLSDSRLERFLKRGNADQNTPVDHTDRMLARMIKEGYIVKVKDLSGGEEIIDYKVGPRGKIEVGEEAVANMVRTVYGGDIADLDQRLNRSLGLGESAQSQAAHAEPVQASTSRGRGRPKRHRDEDD
jgi:hypothetical protein